MKPYLQTENEKRQASDAIRADIEQTRECMDHTLNELGERMKPRHLVDEALGWLHLERADGEKIKAQASAAAHSAGAAAGKAAHAIADAVQQHPIPTLLIGAGVAWAVYESRHPDNGRRTDSRQEHDEYGEREGFEHHGGWTGGAPSSESFESGGLKEKVSEGLESAKEKVSEKVSQAGEQIHETGRQLRQYVSESAHVVGEKLARGKRQLAQKAQHGYEVGREKFVATSQAHPLTVGLGFLAAGVLLGLALPSSRKEDEWVGEAADRVKERAKATGEDLVERGKNVATAAVDAAKKTAEQEGLTPQALKEKAQHVAAETEQAAKQAAQKQGVESAPPLPPPSGSQC